MQDSDGSPPYQIAQDAVLIAGLAGAGMDVDALARHPKPNSLPLKRIGVRLADGLVPRSAACAYRNRTVRADATAPLPTDLQHLPGTTIFGGIAGPQFGHLITQSLGRLWLASHFPDARIVFLAANPGFDTLPGYFHDLLREAGITNPVELVTTSSRCDQLVLGPDLCNLEHRPCAAPAFVDWWRSQRPAPVADPTLDLYVSRSGLSLGHAQYLQEHALEAALEATGYTIIRPEQLSIAEQARLYARARRLVFADGSAAHLWSLFAHPQAKAAVVLRRQRNRHFVAWFQGLDCARPVYLDHCLASLSRRGEGIGRSVGLIDLNAVWSGLRTAGFHDDTAEIGPPRAELDAWIAGLQQHKGRIPLPPFALDPRSVALIGLRSRVTRLR